MCFFPSFFLVSVFYTTLGPVWSGFLSFSFYQISGRWGVMRGPMICFLGLAFSTHGNGRERLTFGNGMALGFRDGKKGGVLMC